MADQKSDINSKEHPDPQNNSSAGKLRKRKVKRGVYWLVGIIFIFLVLIPLLVNFYADRIFGETAREIIRRETGGNYDFDYLDISFNLFNRDLAIRGLVLLPDSTFSDSIAAANLAEEKYFELRIRELHVKGARLWSVIVNRELMIKQFYLGKPDLRLVIPAEPIDKKIMATTVNPKKFDYRDLHTYIKDYLSLLKIDQFGLNDGAIEIYKLGADSTEVIRIENISMSVSNFHLDSLSHQSSEKVFFSDSIGITMKGGHFNLKGNNHEFGFGDINISTVGQSFELLDATIRSKSSRETVEDKGWPDLRIPKILIGGVDFAGMLDGKLLANEILISRPYIKYYLPLTARSGESHKDIITEIFNEVSAIFYPVEIKKLIIEDVNLEIENIESGQFDALQISNMTLELFQLQIDSSFLATPKPFFFIEDFNLSLENQELLLKKPGEKINFNSFNLDTRTSTITVDKLIIASLNPGSHRLSVDGEFPALKIIGKDFKKDFVNGTLNLSLVEFEGPGINFGFNPMIEGGGKKFRIDSLYKYIEGFVEVLAIDKFRIVDAGITFDNGGQVFSKQLKADNLSLELTGFLLEDNMLQAAENVFYSSNIELDLGGLSVKLPDSVHQLNLDRFVLNTKSGELSLEGIHIDTLYNIAGSNFFQKDRMKADVGQIMASGISFIDLYNQKRVDVGNLSVSNPSVFIFNGKVHSPEFAAKDPGFLKNYLVGSLAVSGLDLVVENGGQGSKSFEISGADIFASAVKPVSDTKYREILMDSLKLDAEKLFFCLSDGKQVIETGKISVSKKDSLLQVRDINIHPGKFDKDDFGNAYAISVPDFFVSGFDIDRIYHHNELIAQNMILDHPNVRLVLDKDQKTVSKQTLDAGKLKGQLLNILNKWDLKNFLFQNAAIEIYTGRTFKTKIFTAGDFTIELDDIFVDTNTTMARENILFAADVRLDLNKPLEYENDKHQRLVLDDLSISTYDGHITANEFLLAKNKGLQGIKVVDGNDGQFGFDEMDISGVDFFELINNKNLEIDIVRVESPVFLLKRERSESDTTKRPKQKINFFNLISGHLFEARIGDFNINNASIKILDKKGNMSSVFLVNRVDVDFKDILIDSANNVFNNKFLYSDDLDLRIKDYSYRTVNGLYLVGASDVKFSSDDALLTIDSGYMKPLLGPKAFAAKVGLQTDRFDVVFHQARLENFRLYDLFFYNYFWADQFVLSGLTGEDYRDKSYQRPKNKFPKLPVAALKSLNFGIRLDTVIVKDSYFKYSEYVKPAKQAGEVWLEDISIKGRNITNDEELIAARPKMGFDVKTKLMGEGNVIMNLTFDLHNENNFRTIAVIGEMDLTTMNPLLEHVAFVKVKKGQNNLITFNFDADRDVARGEMDFNYKNLSIRLIDKKTLMDKGFGESVASFVANTFVVRSKNPKWGLFNRTGKIYFQRDKKKSFFNYLVKSTLSGVNSTIRGGNEERKEMRIKHKEERRK